MKRLFNNSGVTLVEVVIAVVILGVIISPILNLILQSLKINMSSDLDIKMKSEIQRAIEEVKATRDISKTNYGTGVFYDSNFNGPFTDPEDDSKKIYLLQVGKVTNTVENADDYDRWDFELETKDDGSATLFKSLNEYQTKGRLLKRDTVESGLSADDLKISFIGELNNDDKYKCEYDDGAKKGTKEFTPGNGSSVTGISSVSSIVLNVRGDANCSLTVENNTCYKSYNSDELTNDGEYKKHIVVNVFSENININSTTPFVDVFHKVNYPSHINNGDEIKVEITNVSTGEVIKSVTSVVGEDVNG